MYTEEVLARRLNMPNMPCK